MLNRTGALMAALLGMADGLVGGHVIDFKGGMGLEPSFKVPTGRTRIAGPRRPAGSKLARMTEQRRIGVTGGSSKRGAYGNWSRTEREQARINNRALRASGL